VDDDARWYICLDFATVTDTRDNQFTKKKSGTTGVAQMVEHCFSSVKPCVQVPIPQRKKRKTKTGLFWFTVLEVSVPA
jgi:hypothetical protein